MHPNHSTSRPILRRGMTMIEIMITVMVLAVGLTAAFSSLFSSKRLNARATGMSLAYQEIQAQIESYQHLPFVSIKNSFKGASFTVRGLAPYGTNPSVGTVTRATNANPWDTSLANSASFPVGDRRYTYGPNGFAQSETKLPLRFRCTWDDNGAPMTVEVLYILTYRGI